MEIRRRRVLKEADEAESHEMIDIASSDTKDEAEE